MADCGTCRFLTRTGCRANLCGQVRWQMRGQGVKVPAAPLVALAWEPMGPDGVTGYLVEWETRETGKEFPPTDEGYIKARAVQGELEGRGLTVTFKTLKRDFELGTATA